MGTFSRTEKTLGYEYQIKGYSTLPSFNVHPIIRLACHTIDSLENLFDFKNPNSMVNRYNNGQVRLHETPELFQNVMGECLFWQKETDGLFSPFNKSMIHQGYNGNIFDPQGILKSFSMQILSEVMSGFELNDYSITVWGDTLISNTHQLAEDWILNIAQPLTVKEYKTNIISLNFENTHMKAIAKSNLQDNMENIWLPQISTPKVQDFLETTIISKDIIAADVWSLVALVEGQAVVERIQAYNQKMVNSNQTENTIEGMFLTGDYEYVFTEGFRQYIV